MLDTVDAAATTIPHTSLKIKINKKLHAKAIYDNTADTPDELDFNKGDILTVIEQNTDGWWLCQLKEKEGLCPGNRLRILNSYDSGCFSPSPSSSPCPSLAASTVTLLSTDLYENASIASESIYGNVGTPIASPHIINKHIYDSRRSYMSLNRVITPKRQGDVFLYNSLPKTTSSSSPSPSPSPSLSSSAGYTTFHTSSPINRFQSRSSTPIQQNQIYSNESIYQNLPTTPTSIMSNGSSNGGGIGDFENYDIPKPATPINYDCPKNFSRNSLNRNDFQSSLKGSSCTTPIMEESYDVPRPRNPSLMHHQNSLTPSSSNSSLMKSDSFSVSFSSSNRSSLINMPDYDIPRANPIPVRALQQTPNTNYDNNQISKALPVVLEVSPTKELPLELSSALETLTKLQTDATAAIGKLLSFVAPNWRIREKLEPVLMEIRLAVVRLRSALYDLTEFAEGALGNAKRSEDRNLSLKLLPLVRALRDANKLIHDSSDILETQNSWSLDILCRDDSKTAHKPPDSLDQLMACAQTLTEDVRVTTSFLLGNASLLFRRATTENTDNNAENKNDDTKSRNSSEWVKDYDYVCFESKDSAAKRNMELREAIPADFKDEFDSAIKTAEATTICAASNPVPSNINEMTDKDKVLIRYYAQQMTTHIGNLGQAIDSFLETVEKNQPPKFFIAYGKFVVVSAHNLVTIGDIVHRNISKLASREKILHCTDSLSDALKACVCKSKRASAHFPNVNAVQEMVDSVIHISHLAAQLKIVMLQAVQMTM